MTRNRAILNRLLVAAPWLTLAALIALSQTLPNRTEFNPATAERKAEIASAMKDVPFLLGRWVGQDAAVPREAQELLQPNAMLSRSYQSPGGPRVHVLVVHCGDARDMIGHYPPVCYRSSGWQELSIAGELDLTLHVSEIDVPVRQYEFAAVRERGREDRIRIFNAFILPDGGVTRRIEDINQQSERLTVSVQGVAQLQVITSGGLPLDEAISAAEEILSGMSGLLEALRVGGNGALTGGGGLGQGATT